MKKMSLVFLLIISTILNLSAINRNQQDAYQIATTFFSNKTKKSLQKITAEKSLRLIYKRAVLLQNGDSSNCFYVYNRGTENGFVIISADDRAIPVLAYSDNGTFDISNMPENLKDWLKVYENEIKHLTDKTTESSIVVKSPANSTESSFASYISPLLGNIKWNQGAPYNNLCPVINTSTGARAVTGCVATGMAQVMKYHQWPAKGTGSNSYTSYTNGIALSLDFSKTTFDWSNMTDTYSSTSTATQNLAVATLMYNCGVAVNMDYAESSGANTKTMATAMKTYFGYDTNLQFYSRNYFDRNEWKNLLKTELNASRPVLYSGYSNDGGHLFVCDGYDSNDLFHFNWGWGGSSNGYFQISALDPAEQGIGGSTGGYNGGQGIVTGLQKPSTSSVATYLLHTNDTLSCSVDSVLIRGTFSVTAKNIFNQGVNSFTGYIGVALYNSAGTFVQILKTASVSELKVNYGWSSYSFSSLLLSPTLATGNYRIYYVYKTTSATSWEKVRGYVGTPNFIDVQVGEKYIKFSTPKSIYPSLQLNSLTTVGNIYQNKTGRFNVSITNNGNEYNSKIHVYLQSINNDTIYQFVSSENINFATGETRNLNFTGNITLNPGQYKLAVMYDPFNNQSKVSDVYQLGSAQQVTISATPTGTPNLILSSPISFPNTLSVERNMATLTAKIKNTSGYFDNKLIAFIFPKTGGNSLTYIGYQNAIFDTNESKTVTFSGSINLDLAQYMTIVYYYNSTTNGWSRITPNDYSLVNFTLVDNALAVFNPEFDKDFVIFPNPVDDVLNIKSESIIQQLTINDMVGNQIVSITPNTQNQITIPVDNLKSGTYILKLKTDSGLKVAKFLKN